MVQNKKKLIIGITAEGSVNLLSGQLSYFKSIGYKTYLLAPYSERSAKFCVDEGCEHLIIDIEREISLFKDFKTLIQLVRIFYVVKPDIINLGTPKVSLLGMIAGWIVGVKKRIYTCRGFRFEHEVGFKQSLLIGMEKLTSKLAHQIICISPSVKNLGLAYKLFNIKKTIVINRGSSNGVNLSLFNSGEIKDENTAAARALKTQLEGKLIYGYVGRIVDRKGINELFRVFDIIFQENNDARLLLIGPFEMNQIHDKTLVVKLEKHPGVILYGKVDQMNVPSFMQLFDIFVLPAWWEGFGNVLVQAAAMGVPVISTLGTGTIDAVDNGVNGMLVPVKDEIALYDAMKLLGNDSNLRKQFGINGQEWAKNFDRNIIWSGMHQIYESN
jgi:glycosyltransferase involved in cell wall biosynthesis